MTVVGVVLAGGRSRRMGGGDKFLRQIAGKRMLDHVLERLTPQVDQVLVSVNGNSQELGGYRLPIVEDGLYAGGGPLAGILAALHWSDAAFGGDTVVASVPADTPFIPLDLAQRLTNALDQRADVAVAASHGQSHHTIAAWRNSVSGPIENWLRRGESFAVKALLQSCRVATVDFLTTGHDPFFNANTPGELEEVQAIAGRLR